MSGNKCTVVIHLTAHSGLSRDQQRYGCPSRSIQQDHSKTQDIKLKVLKAAPGNVYEEHKRFILAFDPEWRKDPHIIFLLCAITLFSPRRPHIIHADAILHEQGYVLFCDIVSLTTCVKDAQGTLHVGNHQLHVFIVVFLGRKRRCSEAL
ncbi:Nuclear hormone receptor HR96 [Portunus trituberculatus]|uniref:Nuclear hormone receptor HR96 n=1 Tax=Portunus trituberculatus TaxID=210409 RepID=A0A5B7FFS6_PORTR|nr:Nuclear hormone receptor HR96 [Portunus trituberculatus]